MPALASNCPSRSPDGPEPTITICVRISNPYFKKSNESKRVSENWALTARIVRLQRAYTSCRVVELVATSRSLQLLAQFPQYPIARQHLFNASVGFAALADCCKELAVLQLDAVHRYVDLADVDLLVLAGIEIVVAGDVGRRVADVAEERAKRAVVIERQRQRTDRAILGLELDAHVHRDAERGTDWALKRIGLHDRRAHLIGEKVDSVRRVMPEQMVGPGARLAERVHVGAAQEVGLHVHLLDMELAGRDLLVDVLVAWIEAARMTDHRDESGLLLHFGDGFSVLETIGERNLHLHMLAGLQA